MFSLQLREHRASEGFGHIKLQMGESKVRITHYLRARIWQRFQA